MEDLSAETSENSETLPVGLGGGAPLAQSFPTSQPIALISPKIWFSFNSLGLQGGRGRGRGRWGRPDLFEQSGCNESSLGSLEVEGRPNGVKRNCRQIVGLDNV